MREFSVVVYGGIMFNMEEIGPFSLDITKINIIHIFRYG